MYPFRYFNQKYFCSRGPSSFFPSCPVMLQRPWHFWYLVKRRLSWGYFWFEFSWSYIWGSQLILYKAKLLLVTLLWKQFPGILLLPQCRFNWCHETKSQNYKWSCKSTPQIPSIHHWKYMGSGKEVRLNRHGTHEPGTGL